MVSEINLSQNEADRLIAMPKLRVEGQAHQYPAPGACVTIPLTCVDRQEEFLLDVNRGRIIVSKVTLQNRVRKAIVLVRLDVDGPPHTNPDGERIECPHLHLYREGYGDRWAQPLPDGFTDPADRSQMLKEFLDYCNVVDAPHIDPSLL